MMPFYQYRDSKNKGKTVSRLSHFYNRNPHTGKDRLYIEMKPCILRWCPSCECAGTKTQTTLMQTRASRSPQTHGLATDNTQVPPTAARHTSAPHCSQTEEILEKTTIKSLTISFIDPNSKHGLSKYIHSVIFFQAEKNFQLTSEIRLIYLDKTYLSSDKVRDLTVNKDLALKSGPSVQCWRTELEQHLMRNSLS